MIKYRRALWEQVADQVVQLARKSFQEVDPRIKNAFDIDVNRESYEAMENSGNYAIFVAEEEGEVLGYLSLVLSDSPHIKGYWQAVVDSMYVDKVQRKHKVCINLIQVAEKYAEEMGCASMTIGFKAKHPHTKFAQSIGFEPDDIMYTKLLEGV